MSLMPKKKRNFRLHLFTRNTTGENTIFRLPIHLFSYPQSSLRNFQHNFSYLAKTLLCLSIEEQVLRKWGWWSWLPCHLWKNYKSIVKNQFTQQFVSLRTKLLVNIIENTQFQWWSSLQKTSQYLIEGSGKFRAIKLFILS